VGGVGPRTYVVRTTARLRLHRLCLNVASSSTVDRSIVPLPGRIISSVAFPGIIQSVSARVIWLLLLTSKFSEVAPSRFTCGTSEWWS
jgi:hypothetical protein